MRRLKSKIKEIIYQRRFPLIEYKPIKKTIPEKTIQVASAWKGLELIIEDILDQFKIDTESFPEVRRAVFDIAKKTGKKAYNYPYHYGLGIIV